MLEGQELGGEGAWCRRILTHCGFQSRSLESESWKRMGSTMATAVVQSGKTQLRNDHQLWQKMDVMVIIKAKVSVERWG